MPGNDLDPAKPGEASAERLPRYPAPLPSFDARWLWSIVVVVPVFLTAGVYWLHQFPAGPQMRAGGPLVEVRLVQEMLPSANLSAKETRPEPAESKGRSEPLIEAPNRPIPEETKASASAPAAVPNASPEPNTVAVVSKPRPMPSGSTSAFQRTLLNHIARFRRYPANARADQRGIAPVMFVMLRDGSVSKVWVQKSSGDPVLDQAAIETIRRAQPLPKIPPDLPDRLTILLPVAFDLR